MLRALIVLTLTITTCFAADARGPGRAGGRPGPRVSSPRQLRSVGAPVGARSQAPGAISSTRPVRSNAGLRVHLAGTQPGAAQPLRHRQHAAATQAAIAGGPKPFSPAWYAAHPNAWKQTHPHADAAVVVSAAAVTHWLTDGVTPAPTHGVSSTTIIYQPSESESGEPSVNSEDATEREPAEAQAEWLDLGVYELKSHAETEATQMVQLAASRQGELKGVYFDHLLGASQNVSGRIDQVTQTAEWSLDVNPAVSFSASLADLTQSQGGVTVTFPAVGAQDWVIERVAAR